MYPIFWDLLSCACVVRLPCFRIFKVKISCPCAYLIKHCVWGSGCIDPSILDLGTSWRWVVSFTARGKSSRYPLERRLCEPQNRPGRREEENNSWPYRDSNSDPSVVQPIASRYTDWAIPLNRVIICVSWRYRNLFSVVVCKYRTAISLKCGHMTAAGKKNGPLYTYYLEEIQSLTGFFLNNIWESS
jgi:hypothetical protein